MCQHMDKEYGNSSCDNCPLCGCSAVYEMCGKENFASMERDISTWAAEHPVVYPTWWDWFAAGGLDPDDPIPADTAQKLGIEPKEGT